MMRVLLPLGLLVALAGYFAAWVAHPVSGLVVTGLDLGEYVKFLPSVRSGAASIWREGFYLPLLATSLAAALAAFRSEFRYRWPMRAVLLALSIVAALNLLPPAWTPTRLLETEFRLQTASLVALLGAVSVSPFLALLPRRIAAILVTLPTLAAIIVPAHAFFRILPEISTLYNRQLTAGWALWMMLAGLVMIIIAYWQLAFSPQQSKPHELNDSKGTSDATWRTQRSTPPAAR